MAYTVTFSDGTKTPITIDSKSIDTTTSIGLWGQGYTNFGEIAATTLLNMLENFANATAPARPVEGQLWFDSSAKIMHYFDDTIAGGGNWKAVASMTVSVSEPTSVGEQEGHFWLDNTTGDISVYYNDAWQFFASASTAAINPPTAVTLVPENRLTSDGTSLTNLLVEWIAPVDTNIVGYEIKWTPTAGDTRSVIVNADATRYEIFGEVVGVAVTVGVVAISTAGTRSTIVYAVAPVAPINDPTIPAIPTTFEVRVDALRFVLTWTNPADTDFDMISVRQGTTDVFGASSVIGQTSGTIFDHVNFAIGTVHYYWIASMDRTGNTSAWVGPITRTIIGIGENYLAAGLYDRIAQLEAGLISAVNEVGPARAVDYYILYTTSNGNSGSYSTTTNTFAVYLNADASGTSIASSRDSVANQLFANGISVSVSSIITIGWITIIQTNPAADDGNQSSGGEP
jgi:hypothetical protein